MAPADRRRRRWLTVDRDRVRAELGDVLWYVAACATLSDLKMSDLGVHAPQPGLSMLQLVQAATRPGSVVNECHVAEIAGRHGITLAEIMEANVDKLARRAATGTIGGSGEDRAEVALIVAYLRGPCVDGVIEEACVIAADQIERGEHRPKVSR